MIRRRPRPTVRSRANRKINRYHDRKNGAENKLIHMMERAMIPGVLRNGPRSSGGYRRGRDIQVYMSEEVQVQCGKKFSRGTEDKEDYSQQEIIEAALKELMEDKEA